MPAVVRPTTTPAAEAHNQADVMFASHMIPHHQQAIEMSDMLLAKQGIDSPCYGACQPDQGGTGARDQADAGLAEPVGQSANADAVRGNAGPWQHAGHAGSRGNAGHDVRADMTALQNGQGVEAAKLFLSQMIAHHEGAITMAQNEMKNGRYPAATELAQTIATTQQQEIDTMKGILASL
jgi:uncharacterized protein (DUF305 family)